VIPQVLHRPAGEAAGGRQTTLVQRKKFRAEDGEQSGSVDIAADGVLVLRCVAIIYGSLL